MSGMAGILYLDGRRVELGQLEAMAASLARRGPDGGGTWYNGPVGLAQRMLWTTPESLHEKLPFTTQEGELAITADARIDNREELISALELSGCPAGDIADSALILEAYRKWGEGCPERLIGDFAFAIWDRRSGKLFCARDPMGLKPLYYHHAAERLFACGSQIQTLLCLPDVPRRLNEVRVLDYLALLLEDRASTFYQEISQLPPAHCLSADVHGTRLRRYWDLDGNREVRLPSEEAYAQALREVFFEAVRCRLRSAYPVGSFLSGGLDSSSITATARRLLEEMGYPARLHSFSAIFPDLAEEFPKIDERPWIQAVVAGGRLEHHDIACDRLDPLKPFEVFVDGPIANPNQWLDQAILEAAGRAGVRVMLSGTDGDTAISYGLGYLADLALTLKWATLFRETAALARRKGRPFYGILMGQVVTVLAPEPARRFWRRLRGRPDPLLTFDPPIHPEFAARLGLERRAQAQRERTTPYQGARQEHRMDLSSGLTLNGPEILDRTGAACGTEVRLPFYDRRLLELAVALPASQKLHDGWTRYAFRRAMEGVLPSKVQWRSSKGNLGANVRRGLAGCRAALDEVIFGHGQGLEAYLDMPALQKTYRNFQANPMDSTEGEVFNLMTAVTLADWLRRTGLKV